ncbi:uncharacterized protein LOC133657845 [Entelurus aequoreus]|uniref:uncharacterized protein LOC133657845 n=1 Tax=Entelurus aequoreus TaxID=161455 RepID=UPI002B1D9281|nr:uncharacterized protein LOC133657845 [Entelurus aequoreus]
MLLHGPGKLQRQRSVAAVGAGEASELLFIADSSSRRRLMVDSGSQVSLLPATDADRATGGCGPLLNAANGSSIDTFGSRLVTVCFHGRKFQWYFIIAAITRLLADFPSLITPAFSTADTKHGVERFIPTVGPPVFARARRLGAAKSTIAKEEFATMERLGIVRRSNSPWASPLHMVPKSDGSWRPCGDFRRLNNITTHDRYPIPYIQDFSACLAGAAIFSKVDLVRGYHQVPVRAEDVPKTALGLDFSGMAADQPDDPDIRALKTDGTALVLEEVVVQDGGPALLCDVSTGRPRPVVLVDWRRRVFDAIHSLSHPGVRASVKLVGALEPFPIPVRRFDHVHVDLVGPLPPSQGYTHLLTMVDRTTRWPEAVPLSSTASVDVARAFLSAWVARFGTPSDITSDRGSQFVSEFWSALAQSLGVQVHRTTAYHPQANGLCERFHRSLKGALRVALVDSNWIDRLPWVMLGLRSAPKEDLAAAPAELVFGQPLRVPGEFLPEGCTPRPFPFLSRGSLAPGPIHHCFPKSFVPSELKSARFVFVRHDAHRSPLQPPYDGPFRVLERGPKNFVLDMGGRRECVSLDRLKPAHCVAGEEILPGQVPRRGRPPKSVRVECLSPLPDPDVCSAPQGTPASRDGHCSRYGRRVRPPDRFSFSP